MKRKFISILFALVLVVSLGLVTAVPVAANGDPVENTNTFETFTTIQDAIDDTDTMAGHTIMVYDTYDSSAEATWPIDVDKAVTIKSDMGAATTIIDASASGAEAAVEITVSTVTLGGEGAGFTIIAEDRDSANPGINHKGIHLTNAVDDVTIEGNVITGSDLSPQLGILIGTFGDSDTYSNIQILNNAFNTTWDVDPGEANPTCGGIKSWTTTTLDGTLLIDKNTITGFSVGMNLEGYTTGTSETAPAIISNNTVYGNDFNGISVDQGTWVEVSSNQVYNNGGNGIAIVFAPGKNKVFHNDVYSNKRGVKVYSYCTTPANVLVHYNNIYDNTDLGVLNDSNGGNLDARFNWWGSTYGPYDPAASTECLAPHEGGWNCAVCDMNVEPTGQLGNAVSEDVDYCPWLTGPCPSPLTLLEPTTGNPATVAPGDNVLVVWFFHADCQPSQDFYIEIYDAVLGRISPQITSTVSGTTICNCYTGQALIPIDSLAEEGTYNVKIRSLCPAGPAEDEEVDAVIVDATPPEVVLTSPTMATNLNNDVDLVISGTMYDAGGISNVLLEFSTDSGTTWPITLYNGDPSGVSYNSVNHTFTKTFDVGTGDLVGINSCLCHVRVTVTDGVGLTASAASGAFIIDNEDPTVTITSPTENLTCDDCLMGGSTVDIVFDYSDNCGPVTADIHYSVGTPVEVVSGLTMPALSGSYTYQWNVPPTLETCDLDIIVTVKDCPENSAQDEVETCATAPLIMVDAITGWTWSWDIWNPINSNTPTSIMVVFNKPLDLDTVERTDFSVTYPTKTITDIEVHTEMHCGEEWQGWTFVFLTVSPLMKTDEMPTVQLKAGQSVKDETGLLILEGPEEVVCQDGIAPLVEVSANPAEPGYNEMVTITVQASEELSEAYLFVGDGSPQGYEWNTCKPIGWPPTWPNEHEPPEAWYGKDCNGGEWLAPPEALVPDPLDPTGKRWIASFRCNFGPDDDWFVEVAAHDFSQWEIFPWKHEKWTEESIKFHAFEYVNIYLYEGWNLISVPRELTDPSVAGFFGTRFSGVTKVYNWDGSRWNGSALGPATGTWIKVIGYGVITIEPGKGYWVWCSPPKARLIMTVVEPDPLVVPPAYSLVKGWNLIGFTALDYPLSYRSMADYLFSLCDICKLVYWYEAQPQEWNRVTPTADWWPSCKDRAKPGYGYWLYLATAGTLAP